MKSDNYIVIQGWMCNELELKGNELLIFAMIYGFSQDGVSKFHGGRKYIASTFNISLPTVDKALQNLVDKQYLNKDGFDDYVNPNVYWVNSEVVKKLYMGSKETLHGGSKETLLNKTSKQKTKKKESNSKELLENPKFEFGKQKSQKQSLYSKCIAMINEFTRDRQVISDLTIYLHILLEMRKDGYNLYTNVWKGLLRKLNELSTDPEIQHKIISQSVERGYKSFFPISNGGNNSGAMKRIERMEHVESMTDEDYKELEKLTEERRKNGLRTSF